MKRIVYPRFTAIYLVICAIVLLADHFHLTWTYFLTKPLVLLIVVLFYHTQTGETIKKRFRNFMITGFLFSALGDFLLMFANQHENYFLLGLVAFLGAHICYTSGFISQIFDTGSWNQHWGQLAFSTLIVVYGAEFFILNRSDFGSLIIPVMIYCIAITAMGVAAVMRDKFINKNGYFMVVTGALLFIISDSLLATNKFIFTFPNSGTIILLTYFTAQYCIATGCAIDTPKHILQGQDVKGS